MWCSYLKSCSIRNGKKEVIERKKNSWEMKLKEWSLYVYETTNARTHTYNEIECSFLHSLSDWKGNFVELTCIHFSDSKTVKRKPKQKKRRQQQYFISCTVISVVLFKIHFVNWQCHCYTHTHTGANILEMAVVLLLFCFSYRISLGM